MLDSENCLDSGRVIVTTLSEAKQFVAKQVWSGMMIMCERFINKDTLITRCYTIVSQFAKSFPIPF